MYSMYKLYKTPRRIEGREKKDGMYVSPLTLLSPSKGEGVEK